MSTAYWSQWDHEEIMSMQGIELSDYHEENTDHNNDREAEEDKCFSSSDCMETLGLSWKDFM
jgi:hypothetical protein